MQVQESHMLARLLALLLALCTSNAHAGEYKPMADLTDYLRSVQVCLAKEAKMVIGTHFGTRLEYSEKTNVIRFGIYPIGPKTDAEIATMLACEKQAPRFEVTKKMASG